jgi:hypothetical protein
MLINALWNLRICHVHNHVRWVPCHGVARPEDGGGDSWTVLVKALETDKKEQSYSQ